MALQKRVKIGGSYYEGGELIVGTALGAHILDITQTSSCMVNSFSVTPDAYGQGDTFTLAHLNSAASQTLAVLAKDIYNLGASLTVSFDFPAFEPLLPGERIRLTYTKADTSQAVTLHTIIEYGGITKTA